ncbi:MAG TPA: thioredoxin [Spirochaetia bacterium]|nr:thioredoxin [Spirochaetia bacterium]
MTLPTNLKHVETAKELQELVTEEKAVMVCCGRMGPMCVPVYGAMEELQKSEKYQHVAFRDMAFDSPESDFIRALPECRNFRGLPFTVYFKDGKVAKATSSVQAKDQITTILDEVI